MRRGIAYASVIAMEGTVVVLALGSVWPFASVHPFFQWILYCGVGFLLVCWAVRALAEGRLLWKSCPVVALFAALCSMTILQIVPLPIGWVQVLSPNSVKLRQSVMPSAEEFGQSIEESTATISVDPGATRRELMNLIAMLGLFATIRTNLRDPGAFYRFAWLLAANGVMLALLGMGQIASSPNNVIYWTVPTAGVVFGPFITRNFAAYYLNLCIGLTSGLLLGTRYFLAANRGNWREMFRDPRVLWLISGLAIMFAGLIATLSRGGLIGLLIGGAMGLLLLLSRRDRSIPWLGLGLIVLIAGGLLVWQGDGRVIDRWDHSPESVVKGEERVGLWKRSLPLVLDYPLLGSGIGTFMYVEQTQRAPTDLFQRYNEHAHNDFLQLWIEGGIVQLLLGVAIALILFQRGFRAFKLQGDTGLGRLALGALIAYFAIVVHSFVDFGLHIPAVAVLTTVVGALIMNLSELTDRSQSTFLTQPTISWTAVGEAAALVAVATYLTIAGWKDQQAERYRIAARSADWNDKVAYLSTAISYAPDQLRLYAELGEALNLRHAANVRQRTIEEMAATIAQASATRYPTILTPVAVSVLPVPLDDLKAANAVLLTACRRSPVSYDVQAQLELTASLGYMNHFRDERLDRVLTLVPSDSHAWLGKGWLSLARRDRAGALSAFNTALASDKTKLDEVLVAVPDAISAKEFAQQVAPSNPQLLLAAAKSIVERTGDFDAEILLNEAALKALDDRPALSPPETLIKARVHAFLEQKEPARKAFQAALDAQPFNHAWRVEYGQFLLEIGDLPEARKQLLIVTSAAPRNAEAAALYQKVIQQISEKQ